MTKQNQVNSDYYGLEELLNSEVMSNYNFFIVDLAMKSAQKAKKVIDFGAGVGTLSLVFRDSFSIDPLCIEIDKINQKYLSERMLKFTDNLSKVTEPVDMIFSSNVLEHIEDDVSVLELMRDKLSDNGIIYLYLPAKMFLWSRLDQEVGHYRRYEIDELKLKCQQVGLNIQKIHYADSVGFFASIAMKVIGYNKNSGIGSVSSLRFYDKWLFPVSRFLDQIGCKYLFGKNVVLIASKN